MRKIQNPNLAELLIQLRFTPPQKRQNQLENTIKLLTIVEPQNEYPFEFVFYNTAPAT